MIYTYWTPLTVCKVHIHTCNGVSLYRVNWGNMDYFNIIEYFQAELSIPTVPLNCN